MNLVVWCNLLKHGCWSIKLQLLLVEIFLWYRVIDAILSLTCTRVNGIFLSSWLACFGRGGGSSQQCGSDFHQNIIEEDIKDVVHGSLSPDPSNIL